MTDLSPAAQAVLDAIERNGTVIYGMPLLRPLLAAALRAAADQLGYCRAPGADFEDLYGRIVDVDDLLAIAAELDGTNLSESD